MLHIEIELANFIGELMERLGCFGETVGDCCVIRDGGLGGFMGGCFDIMILLSLEGSWPMSLPLSLTCTWD